MTVRVFGDEDIKFIRQVFESGNLCSINGKMTPRFERAFAEAVGAKYAVAYNSAMSVLHAAVSASGAGAGDEVICDPLVQFGAAAIMYNNAVPVFADIRPHTHLIDPDSVRERVSPRTKAIIVTHLWGLPADMDPIMEIAREHNLIVIEDCAHSLFATYKGKNTGTLGHIGSFSFQMSKQLATGDGGMATTDNPFLYEEMVDGCGVKGRATFPRLMWNYRMTEVISAIGMAQLRLARTYVEQACQNASFYNEAVADVEWIRTQSVPPERTHSYHIWAGAFYGDEYGIEYEGFKKAVADLGCSVSFGYIGKPAYLFELVREPLAYGRGCPIHCPHHPGINYQPGLCPNAEDLMPRLMLCGTSGPVERHRENAEKLRSAIEKFL